MLSSDTAKQLFEAHIDILQGLSSFLESTRYDGSVPEAHGWCHLHALSKATSPEIVVKQEKKVVVKQKKPDKKGKGKEWAI